MESSRQALFGPSTTREYTPWWQCTLLVCRCSSVWCTCDGVPGENGAGSPKP